MAVKLEATLRVNDAEWMRIEGDLNSSIKIPARKGIPGRISHPCKVTDSNSGHFPVGVRTDYEEIEEYFLDSVKGYNNYELTIKRIASGNGA